MQFLIVGAWLGLELVRQFRADGAQARASASPESVTDMRRTPAGLRAEDNGRFLNHDGAELAW
jgi:hypothetical protein